MQKSKILIFIALLTTSTLCAQPLAFPDAEGFGKYATGGRGGKVVTVTNLLDYTDDANPITGSLRWALEQHKSTQTIDGKEITIYEPLTIVFNISGNIDLVRDLKVRRDNLTIAGQSSPGGICITGHSMLFNGATGGEMWYWGPRRKNLIIRYLRFRPTPPGDDTYVTYGTDIENYENVIIDHCTMSWANEENLAIYDTKNTTVQWCMLYEGLYKAHHKKNNRSYCGVWGGQFASYHHNLIAHHNSRNVRFNGVRNGDTLAIIDFRNNLVYNWGSGNSGYGLEMKADYQPTSRNELNMTANYYRRGPATSTSNTISKSNKAHRLVCIDQTPITENGEDLTAHYNNHYIQGNYIHDFEAVTANNWNYGVQYSKAPYSGDSLLANTTFRSTTPSAEVAELWQTETIETAQEAFESVLSSAGCTLPCRDWQDARIAAETRTGTASAGGTYGAMKGIIDTIDVVGGVPTISPATYIDTDLDGIPDHWEQEHNLDPNNTDDGAYINADGYSNLEHYLNSIEPTTTALPQVANNEHITIVNQQDGVKILSDIGIANIAAYNYSGALLSLGTANDTYPHHSVLVITFNNGTRIAHKLQ